MEFASIKTICPHCKFEFKTSFPADEDTTSMKDMLNHANVNIQCGKCQKPVTLSYENSEIINDPNDK